MMDWNNQNLSEFDSNNRFRSLMATTILGLQRSNGLSKKSSQWPKLAVKEVREDDTHQ